MLLLVGFAIVLSCNWIQAEGKNCEPCISVFSCPAAVALLGKTDEHSKSLLKSKFCGWAEDKLAKVCCANFNSAPQEPEDLENHPNRHLLPEKCGIIDGDRIIGGTKAGIYEFPWMALISSRTRTGLRFHCGGSIINERYILTAAHCVKNLKLAGVRIGEYDIRTQYDCQGAGPQLICESKIQDILIEEVIYHENFAKSPNLINDIGLLRLRKPIDFSYKNAYPICLPISKELQSRDLGGSYATVAGWGYTETGYESSVLLKVRVPVHNQDTCRRYYNRRIRPVDADETINKLCAGEPNKDSCRGDSGGPLMVEGEYTNVQRYVQHGIVSYGPKLCGSDFPGVYTDVAKYMKWILDHIRP